MSYVLVLIFVFMFDVGCGCDVWHKINLAINDWHGDLNVITDTSSTGVELQLLFDEYTEVRLNDVLNVSNGLIEIQLKASYDEFDNPVLNGVTINGVDIVCDKEKKVPVKYQPQVFQQDLPPPPQITYTIREECGIVIPEITPYIHYGMEATTSEFPWQTAIFDVPCYKYRCGGSLISHNLVVTAAHCVTDPYSIAPISSSSIVVVLGKDQLHTSSIVEQKSTIAGIHVHQSFDPNTFNNDIAAIKLQTRMIYTNFVRPVCIWPHANDRINSIVDHYGSIPGFGYNEHNQLPAQLMSVKMPVVSYETCLSSHRDFYARVISETNFCAGSRNGSSVCNGDSGGGMVFQINSLFYLRGIVSIGPAGENDRMFCNTKNFIVFTDVAKYVDWLRQF